MKELEIFQKLIKSVKANCPGLITEEIQDQFNTEFNDAITSIRTDAYNDGFEHGQQDGFKDGYAQAKRIADENLQAETEKIIAQCDDEAVAKITEILQAIDQQNTEKLQVVYELIQDYRRELEQMDADHAQKLQTAVESISRDHAAKLNECVDFIDQKHAKQLKLLVEAIDRDHTKKLKTITESIDQLHANKLQTLVESIDADHAKKLQECVNKEKNKKLDVLTESVEKYLNYALEKNLPKKQLVSEQKYNVALKTLDKIKDYLKVNGIIQESKDGILTDYEQQITNAKNRTNKLISENAELNKKLQKQEAQMLLQEKLKECTPAQVKYLRVRFKNAASPKVIQESIEEAKATFKKLQAEKRAKVQAEFRKNKTASTQPSSVVLQSKEKESKKQTTAVKTTDNIAEFYASYLKQKAK